MFNPAPLVDIKYEDIWLAPSPLSSALDSLKNKTFVRHTIDNIFIFYYAIFNSFSMTTFQDFPLTKKGFVY